MKKISTFVKSLNSTFLMGLGLLMLNTNIQANNVAITVPVVDQTAKTVTFDVSWDNSWNIQGSGVPNNWDAVWLFIKWKECAASAAIPYTHGTLSGALVDRTIPATLEVMSTVNLNGTLNAAGVNTVQESAALAGALDFTDGIMVRRSAVGTGTMAAQTIVLTVPGLPAAATQISLSVFGIEMVYVTQGDLTIGDGDGAATATNSFMATNTLNTGLPMTVTNAFETGASTFYINNAPAGSVTTVAGVPAAWPKGQCGFYIMKYEISQQQYAEFLNTLATGQLATRYPTSFSTNRNRTQTSTSPFSSDRPERAQNYLSPNDVMAYCDWACLRPMTEMEYEKACRGNGSTRGEYAWGNTVITPAITFSGAENGSETTIAGNCVYSNSTWTNGDAGQGPARCGIFATATSTRQQAGASYYGVMDLSGNVRDFVIALHGTPASNTYTRSWGNGDLSAAGNHDPATWPLWTAAAAGTSLNNFWGHRGGGWNNAIAEVQVSSRYYIYVGNTAANTKDAVQGGRGVR